MKPETVIQCAVQCLPNHTEFYGEEIQVIGAMCFKNFKECEIKLCPVVIVLRQWTLACCSLCKENLFRGKLYKSFSK